MNAHVEDARGGCSSVEDAQEGCSLVDDAQRWCSWTMHMAFCDWVEIKASSLWADIDGLSPSELGFPMLVYK